MIYKMHKKNEEKKNTTQAKNPKYSGCLKYARPILLMTYWYVTINITVHMSIHKDWNNFLTHLSL